MVEGSNPSGGISFLNFLTPNKILRPGDGVGEPCKCTELEVTLREQLPHALEVGGVGRQPLTAFLD